jgi:hypothetical protein
MSSMAGIGGGAASRPGWLLEGEFDPIDQRLRQRRWRILRATLPAGDTLPVMPTWVRTPEQFVGWLVGRLAPHARAAYFRDLADVAKQTCDLELFRLARKYQRRR